MAESLPALVVVVPLMAALAIPLASRARVGAGWWIAVAALAFALGGSLALLARVAGGGRITYAMGGWPAPSGIPLVVDGLNGMVLVMVAASGLAAAIWMRRGATIDVTARARDTHFAVLLLFLTGLMGIAITGDVFNLYVFLEISSISAYVLVASGRDRRSLYAGFTYLILGSLGATFVLIGIGHLYMATGTLAMSDLATRIPLRYDDPVVRTAYAFFTVGLALKMALFPLHGWQPGAYTHGPAGATIALAATATKVAAYAFYRVSFDVFGPAFLDDVLPIIKDGLLVMCAGAMLVGPLLAVRQEDLKRLLAYSSVGQIGYVMLGVVLFERGTGGSTEGVVGGLVHFWNHAVAKAALFCVAGALVYRTGAARMEDLAGLGRRAPWTAAVATLAALSLTGIPLFAGFWSKFHLAVGAVQVERGFVVAVLLASSLLTAAYSWRILQRIWFAPREEEPAVASEVPWSMRLPALALGLGCLLLGLFPVHVEIARVVAEGLVG